MSPQSRYRLLVLASLCCGIAAAQTPTIQRVVNGASLAPPLCPGGLAVIFGANLGPSTSFAGQAPGLTVTINNEATPVSSSFASQIGIQVPFDLPVGPATVVVKYQGAASAPFTIQLLAVAPGILTVLQNGNPQPVFARSDGSVGSPQNPANPGETVSIFMVGLGPTTPAVAAGVIPADPVVIVNIVTMTVGGETAKVVYAALTNTVKSFGVYQVNFTVPLDLP